MGSCSPTTRRASAFSITGWSWGMASSRPSRSPTGCRSPSPGTWPGCGPPLRGSAWLRLTRTRSRRGSRPLAQRGESPLTVIVALGTLTERGQYCDVVTVPWPRNERSALSGLKTTSYAENVLALSYARDRDGGEAIFGNTAGNLCEGTGSNVFVVAGGRLITPPLSSGCLAGVTRGLVIEWVGADEEDLPIGALAAAEEAFLTGPTRDVQPSRSVDGTMLPAAPGPVTRKVADRFMARAAEVADP